MKSFVATLKDLYYLNENAGNAEASSAFVHAMKVVIDGDSAFLREPKPQIGRYSHAFAKSLQWRINLFDDPLAFYLLKTNVSFFIR